VRAAWIGLICYATMLITCRRTPGRGAANVKALLTLVAGVGRCRRRVHLGREG